MFSLTILNLKQAIRSFRFWFSFFLGLLLFIRPLLDAWSYGIFPHYSPMMLLSLPLATSDFTPFAAVFAILPYSTSFCDEYNSGYLRSILLRVSKKNYIGSKIISVAFSGALVIALIFSTTISICVIGAGQPNTQESVEFLRNTLWWKNGLVMPYNGLWVYWGRIGLAFIFGAVWAIVALGISSWWTNKYVVVIAPFVLYQALWILLPEHPFNPLYLLRADYAGIPSFTFILLYQGCWLLIWSIVALLGIRRRFENA